MKGTFLMPLLSEKTQQRLNLIVYYDIIVLIVSVYHSAVPFVSVSFYLPVWLLELVPARLVAVLQPVVGHR